MIKIKSTYMHIDNKCYHCRHSISKLCDIKCKECPNYFGFYQPERLSEKTSKDDAIV
jgi:hypothetical protein